MRHRAGGEIHLGHVKAHGALVQAVLGQVQAGGVQNVPLFFQRDRLPAQAEALSMMDCLGDGKAVKFAEIIGAVVLAGELSTLCAQSAGQLGSAHSRLGR
jgi:hypothetical protein